jgi:hypothetical protein
MICIILLWHYFMTIYAYSDVIFHYELCLSSLVKMEPAENF